MEKKKAAAAAVATVISASGVAVEATFDDPADILQNTNVQPQVQHIDADVTPEDDGVQNEEEKQNTPKGVFRQWILNLPLAVRVFFVIPQWILGTLIVGAGHVVFTALSPFAHWILSFLLMALIIGAAFTVTAKAMFPDLPLRKILNRKTIKGIMIATVVAFAADLLLGLFWVGYTRYKMLVIAGLMLVALLSLTIWFSRREKRRRDREAQASEEAAIAEEPEELVFTSLGETFTVKPSADRSE